jgi:hypothetical protein
MQGKRYIGWKTSGIYESHNGFSKRLILMQKEYKEDITNIEVNL